ncbi:MAG: hypothetical protein AB1744_15575, partial [Candidatus Zixiibacteriota bacterium]
MQGATNQAVAVFTLATDKSEALFNSIKLQRTGTSSDSDITAVKIYYDGNNNGLLDTGTTWDWVISDGYFGNAGTAGEALMAISTSPILLPGNTAPMDPMLWSKVITSDRGIKKYFVTYDMSDLATPDMTAGVKIAEAAAISVSAPNYINTANLPFNSSLHNITPKPRVVTVVAEPLNVANLAQPLGSSDNIVYVQSVNDFPDVGALVIEQEIILYTSRNPGDNSFSGLTRGAWNTAAADHSAGTQVSRSYLQGTLNVPYLKLTLSCDAYLVRWYQLRLRRENPVPGREGNDTDIKQIRIWKDNGDGLLNRTPEGYVSEILISTNVSVFDNAVATCAVGGYGVDVTSRPYYVITATPTIFWVTIDIDPN